MPGGSFVLNFGGDFKMAIDPICLSTRGICGLDAIQSLWVGPDMLQLISANDIILGHDVNNIALFVS
jgi:hypothetical protein